VRLIDRALIAYARAFEHPAKIRIIRWLARHLATGRIFVRYAPGAMIGIDPADFIGWAIFSTGRYELASLRLALQIMQEEPGLFVDVGSNFGWYTCAVGAIPGATVISIEPDCGNCTSLQENIALNHLQNVTVFNAAVGTEFATVEIGRRARANSGTVAVRSGGEEHLPDGIWVATIPVEVLLKRLVRPAVRPALVKIDVEGFEPQVLTGLDFDGPFRPKHVLLEFDAELSRAAWGSFANLRSFFATRGYELFDVFGAPLHEGAAIPEANVWARERKPG